MTAFPDAEYLVLASRLIPDLDGGFTISVLRRALDMSAAGVAPTLLTIDPRESDAHDADRAEWASRGMLPDAARLRNLFDDARADPAWVRAASLPAPIPDSPWPYRAMTDADGRTVLELPVVSGDPAWHLTDAPVRVWDDTGPVGWLPGYAGLHRAWLNAIAARAGRPVVLVCESRQVGEGLLAAGEPALDPRIRVVHTTHACHLLAPFEWDSPMDAAWQRWLAVADRFDAVLWLTPSQQRDIEQRFGHGIRSFVVPHPAPAVAAVASMPVSGRIVMLNSLIPRKRVDHALRALALVRGALPHVELHVVGSGPQRPALERLAAELGVSDAVVFAGQVADTSGVWAEADVLVLASTNEGQPLVVLEALAHGVPVVSYDMPYGPHDTLARGGGVLVADGDVPALAAALTGVIGDRAVRDRLSAEGRVAAGEMDAAASMRALGEAVRAALADPVTR